MRTMEDFARCGSTWQGSSAVRMFFCFTVTIALFLSYATQSYASENSATQTMVAGQHIREQAKASMLDALTPTQKAKVQSIISSYNAGHLSFDDSRSAIAGLLSDKQALAIQHDEYSMLAALRSLHSVSSRAMPNGFPVNKVQAGMSLLMLMGDQQRVILDIQREFPVPNPT